MAEDSQAGSQILRLARLISEPAVRQCPSIPRGSGTVSARGRFSARFEPRIPRRARKLQLMREMVAAGEAEALVAERVWHETEFGSAAPTTRCVLLGAARLRGAAGDFRRLLPLWGVPHRRSGIPRSTPAVHLLIALQQSARLSPRPEFVPRFLVHDLAKARRRAVLAQAYRHEERSVELAATLCRRLPSRPLPRTWRCRGGATTALPPGTGAKAGHVLKVLEGVDAFRRSRAIRRLPLGLRRGCARAAGPGASALPSGCVAARGSQSSRRSGCRRTRSRGLDG